ncbi:transglycosylase domain-containing protein [Clostridium fallax]|uniref:Penicillin-binding protein 1A n=1 Tax=Clostridium fallax TaxID=1533 RepID=A0A1M4UA15_9CLOT|nr:PBP1A family penicillin-binding protein [Clostridium fallax]SHE53555.1 penicillin-binding protein 1A [Clostridium fallax]SQB06154.1 penicillin-binding protein 1A [Clostridium fallax]
MANKTIKNTKKSKKKNKKRSIFKNILMTFLFLILTVFVIGAGYVFAIISSTPALDVNAVLQLNQPSRIYDNKNEFMDNVQTEEQRFVVPLEDTSKYLQDAFISIEDERFYQHKGIDVRRIVGAAILDVKNIFAGRRGLHGASTITQQLLKNTILTNDISISRKVKEIYLALQLERELGKNQILEAYLNTIPLGGHTYGVEAAANKYFSKSAKDLNLLESAYLSGVTQAPTLYNALTAKSKEDPSPYINRTKTVLMKMHENQKITTEEYNQAIQDIDNGKLAFNPSKKSDLFNYEYFSRAVIDQVKKDLKSKYKYSNEEVNKLIMNGGLQIHSTMDRSLQDYTKEVLNDPNNFNVRNNKSQMLKDSSGNYTYPALQASASVMDYKTGEVKALVGGRGTQPPKSLNRAYSELRPIGSTTKPLTVYAPVIDMKMMTAATATSDTPLPQDIGKQYPTGNGPYNPKNEDNRFMGSMTLREALKYSRNLPAVKVAHELGIKNAVAYGEKFGLIYNNNSKGSISAVALGQFDGVKDGSNPFYLSAAYGVFGNNGLYTEPKLYSKVIDATGKVLLENQSITRKVLSPQSSFILYDMLKEPLNYSAGAARFGNMPVSGKTGTTSGNKDLWFSGLTPYLSATVWVGYDKPTEVKGTSGAVVTPIWGKIMKKAHEGLAVKEIDVPEGVVKGTVCQCSGGLPTDLCRNFPGNSIATEWFIEGTEPSKLCDAHVVAKINRLNGKLATDSTPQSLIVERVFVRSQYAGGVDSRYVLPREKDDMVAEPPKESSPPKVETNNESKENTETNKDNNTNTGEGTAGNAQNNNSSTGNSTNNNSKPNNTTNNNQNTAPPLSNNTTGNGH